jgi:hypothetical protein
MPLHSKHSRPHDFAPRERRHGIVLVYCVLLLVLFAAFVSLGVDWGRVQLCKTELSVAADAAAREKGKRDEYKKGKRDEYIIPFCRHQRAPTLHNGDLRQ